MHPDNHITSSCVISGNKVITNGRQSFENKEEDLPGFLLAAYRHLDIQYPKFHKMDPMSRLGWLGAEFLLNGQKLTDRYPAGKIGLVLSNASSSLDTDIRYYASTHVMASPALFVYTLPNIVSGEICIRHGFKGENAFFVTEDFDAALLHQYAGQLLDEGIVQAAVCGWVELLGGQYKTVLFLVEKRETAGAVPFTIEQINKIYQSDNG